uniref:Uncharacterized protein n=1 Tax=Myotis myotis TaxID=51298 RepID=A0A7J7WHG3_MYOMY|nr:hypothetical protein mMyoMyo1_012024 [Myotis myotis]
MSAAAGAGAGLRAAAAAASGKSLGLSDAFAGPAGDAPARPPGNREARSSPPSSAGARSPGPAPLEVPGVPAPQPGVGRPRRPRGHRGTASGGLGWHRSRCRRRCERSRDFVQGCSRLCAPHTALSPVPPTARRAVPALLPFGTPGPLFWTRDRASSEGAAAFSARAAGPASRLRAEGELAGTAKSCSEGRRRWVVGGGGGWGRR